MSSQFRNTSLENAYFEDIRHFAVLRKDCQAILLDGPDYDIKTQELHFAANEHQLIIDTVKTLFGLTLNNNWYKCCLDVMLQLDCCAS
jgi:hypothetical protein